MPAKQKPKVESFPDKKSEEVYIEEEEISDDPTVLKGAKINRLGIIVHLLNLKLQLSTLDAKFAEVIKKDPERDCRKYNVKARAKEIFNTLGKPERVYIISELYQLSHLHHRRQPPIFSDSKPI